jgi:hypothetical protein
MYGKMSLRESRPEKRGIAIAVILILQAMICRQMAMFVAQGQPGIQSFNSPLLPLARSAWINYCSASHFGKGSK